MLWTILLFACSFLLSVLLTPLLRDFALRRGWVDRPDNNRKLHKVPIPRIGGVPIVLAYAGSLSLPLLIGAVRGIPVRNHLTVAGSLLLPACFVFLLGLMDDLIGLQPWGKLGLETLAALLAYVGGIQIHDFLGSPIPAYLGLPLTIAWLIGCTNAFNLIDGLDGLSSGIGLIATLTTLGAGMVDGDVGLVTATAPLAGALGGFLVYNFNPASVFLGDSGSLSIGFLLACCGVIWSQKSVTAISVTAPMMALFLPLLETGLSIARRLVRCQSIFHADRGHIHHQLLDRGLSPRRVVLVLYTFGVVGAGFSLLQSMAPNMIRGFILIAFGVVVWWAVGCLHYQEFAVAPRLLRRIKIRSTFKEHFLLDQYEKLLIRAADAEECWRVVQAVGHEFTFTHAELRLNGRSYKEQSDYIDNGYLKLQIPLLDSDFVRFSYQLGTSTREPAVVQMADVLHRCLSIKRAEFSLRLKASDSVIPMSEVRREASLSAHA